jgi:response regulator RpfG family c-di-GMP phosphodiesterase
MQRSAYGTNQRIADRLLADGRINREQHARAVEYAARFKSRIEDALVECEILSELDLLKYIATLHGTKFVSTEKLAKAVIDPKLLLLVPAKLADLHGLFPVLLDERGSVLSVVTPDPDNDAAIRELRLAARVREARALVARPTTVRAAIRFHYQGDKMAFSSIDRPLGFVVELGNHDPFEKAPAAAPAATPLAAPAAAPAPAPAAPPKATNDAAPARGTVPPDHSSIPVLNLPAPVVSIPPTATHEFVETLNVLVSLLENSRPDLRGHSSMVARLTKKTCERIGLSNAITAAYVAAAYLHDLGKMGAYHLTALNVAEYEGHRIAAMKSADLPAHLMESVGLLPDTAAAIGAMYERYDGQGLPNGQAGKEIPLGARVLSVVDTYADLTQNPRNPYRKILRPFEACEVLVQYRGAIFDPNIVDLFRQAMTGDDLRAKLLSDRHLALIVDPDPEETTVLELRMVEQGFEVRIARTAAQALRELESGEVNVVVSEMDLDQPDAGLALREAARKEPWGRELTWVVLTSKGDRKAAQRAFDLGVDDYVSKPVTTDIFVAKLRQLIDRRAARSGGRGVSGSLAEMSLPDMVQILWHGRKTCALRIQNSSSTGEIDFAEGQIVNARWDALRGEDAFYKMLALKEGDFRLDPSFKPGARVISASPEALLLEGMRRLDEGSLSS